MKKIILITISFIVLALIVIFMVSSKTEFLIKKEIREPVFAGSWYPSDEKELRNLTEEYLNNLDNLNFNGTIKAVIVPHAGYIYSGQIAAAAFKQLDDEYETVFLIGPSHSYPLTDVSVSNLDYFSTPLGRVKVSDKSKEILKENIVENIEEAHSNEHSLEVEIPFLQMQLKDFEIVPLIVGETDVEEFKNVLSRNVGEEDLIVVSVDLSHYHEYNEALSLDYISVKNIMELNYEKIISSEIDAPWAVSSLLKLAKEKYWKPYLITYSNSGEVTGDKTSVVGYSAIVFVEEFNNEDKEFLLNLARKSAEEYLKSGEKIEVDEKDVPINLRESKACFVTFIKDEQLRGCIGHIVPQMPLYQCVIENSINAATKDPRFSPMNSNELKASKIDVSVLTLPTILEHKTSEELLYKLNPYQYGVILQRGENQSTFLPSVWEFIPNKQEFLANLCIKGNMEADCWKDPRTEIYIYEAIDFSE